MLTILDLKRNPKVKSVNGLKILVNSAFKLYYRQVMRITNTLFKLHIIYMQHELKDAEFLSDH